MLPISLTPAADEVLDRLTGCWSQAPQCFHSLVALRMGGGEKGLGNVARYQVTLYKTQYE
jgi:hypothetical protein